MIASVDQNPAPLRLALGSDSYDNITKALTDRLARLETQRELARSTDSADQGNTPAFFPTEEG